MPAKTTGKLRKLFVIFFVPVVFLALGIATLSDYGINWDTINHLPRGQAYLNYFLTGRRDFSNLEPRKLYWQKPNTLLIDSDIDREDVPRRSMYQDDSTTFEWFVGHDGEGHPPLSDILSSVFNLVFFQKLRLVNDIDSYRIYGVFLAASLVGLIFWWTSKAYGNFAGLVAAISLSLYPLFWSESHFNTEKDVPETVFWGFLLFSVWRGITTKSWKWILASGVFFGLALGTKFNILFSAFVIIPWLVVSLKKDILKNPKIILAGLAAPILGVLIFVGSWPYLWAAPIARIKGVLGFYKSIGLTESIDARFLGPFGINTYPLQWIAYTMPLIILFLAIVGIVAAFYRLRQEKDKVTLLFLLWLAVPIVRVAWPGTTIYGGVRQIMEFIPALAILAGLGGLTVRDLISGKLIKVAPSKLIASSLVLVTFVPITIKLIKIHPNENVYFNPLIGGLAGARERDFPSWGHSFGAPYRSGVNFINENAEKRANVAYAFELIPNIPRIWLRQDLNLHNSNRSGYLRLGEYVITLISQGTSQRSYFDRYLDRALIPVYESKVDGVPVLKVWKNDKEHTRQQFLNEKQIYDFKIERIDQGVRFDFGASVPLSRIEADFSSLNCKKELKHAFVQISKDGKAWERLPGVMPNEDWSVPRIGVQPEENHLIVPFVRDEAHFLDLVVSPPDSCLSNLRNTKVYIFED